MNSHKSSNILIILAKLPEPGKVKTRLAKDLGEKRAAEAYSQMARHIISCASNSNTYETSIFFYPPDKKREVADWLSGISKLENESLIPQEGNSLGQRISNAFKRIFSKGAEKAVIIGTDCIDVTPVIIKNALIELNEHDCVIGPAEDGGYYLLALSQHTPGLFDGIDWSTERVLEQSLERAESLGLTYSLLETLSDIDNVEDLISVSGDLNFK